MGYAKINILVTLKIHICNLLLYMSIKSYKYIIYEIIIIHIQYIILIIYYIVVYIIIAYIFCTYNYITCIIAIFLNKIYMLRYLSL